MRRLALPIAVAAAAVAVLGLLVFGLTQKAANNTLDNALAQGQRPAAPVGRLPVLSGTGSGSLGAYRGKVVVLNFWASWCDPCKAEVSMLQSAQGQLQRHNATVLGVTDLDAAPDAQGFVARYRLTYPNLRDVDGRFAHSYGTNQLPETFVIDRQGRIAAISRGEVKPAFLDRAVALAASS